MCKDNAVGWGGRVFWAEKRVLTEFNPLFGVIFATQSEIAQKGTALIGQSLYYGYFVCLFD